MTITIKYFGLIADITNKKEEEFTSDAASLKTGGLLNDLHQKYADLRDVSYVIAVNEKIETGDFQLNNNDTIALLPPFAGG